MPKRREFFANLKKVAKVGKRSTPASGPETILAELDDECLGVTIPASAGDVHNAPNGYVAKHRVY